MTIIEFPIVFTRLDNLEPFQIENLVELETTLEFLNDWTDDYQCFDADGKRWRLIIESLALVLAMPVPGDWNLDQLRIVSAISNGRPVVAELSDGKVHRAIIEADNRTRRALASTGDRQVILEAAAPSSIGPSDFDDQWMKLRRRQPWFPRMMPE